MEHSAVDSIRLLWAAGWLIAVLVLFVLALRVPLQPGVSRLRSLLLNGGVVVAALAVVVLANMALSLHDVHFDATYEKVYTPAAEALAVVDKLDRPVSLTYLYQGQDPQGSRMREMAELI